MISKDANRTSRKRPWFLLICLLVPLLPMYSVLAQPAPLPASLPDQSMERTLERRGSLTLRDATVIEALFALRQQWNIDMVVSDTIDGQINATFSNASLREILDSLLLSRGYGYQIVGNSIVILPLGQLGAFKPLFHSEVIPLKHADPAEVTAVIELLLSPQGKAMPIPSAKSVMVLDFPDRMTLIKQRVASIDQPPGGSRNPQAEPAMPGPAAPPSTTPAGPPQVQLEVRVFRPQFVKVDTLLPVIQSLISESGRVTILENEDQVLVADQPDLLPVIEEAVAALDRPRTQVRIWAMIYDVSLEDKERLGINWEAEIRGNSAADIFTLASSVVPAVGAPLVATGAGRNVDITARLQMLRESKDSKLLADPNIVVTNHEPARIEIVTEFPYQQLTESGFGGSIGTTAFREAGVTLEVTPHIARDGTISMAVNPRFSVRDGVDPATQVPIINRREAKTTVRVMNGQTFILGGLRQRAQLDQHSGIPYLKDVKYIGPLFRSRSQDFRESELLVFITPEIVAEHGQVPLTPREDAAADFGQEDLNYNRRAPDVCLPNEIDLRSQGGPARETVIQTIDAEMPGEPLPPTPGIDAATGLPPEANQPAKVPLIQRLKNPLRAAPGAGQRPAAPQTPRSGSPGTPPGLSVPNILEILQMKGEERATRPAAGSAPKAVQASGQQTAGSSSAFVPSVTASSVTAPGRPAIRPPTSREPAASLSPGAISQTRIPAVRPVPAMPSPIIVNNADSSSIRR